MYSIIQLALLLITLAHSAPTPDHLPTNLYPRTSSPGYGTLSTTTNGSIVRAVINNPPLNLWDYKLASDISSFVDNLAANINSTTTANPKVVIFSSANPDFFIAHYDIHALSTTSPVLPPGNSTLIGEQLLRTRTNLATLPVIFIAEINGRASGAGNEFAVQCDIRYAGPGAKLSQLEIGFGLIPGAGGVQFLVKLIGRARALEYILSGRAVDAVNAAAIGWVNKAFGSVGELVRETDALAERIAAFPEGGLAGVKARVNVQKPGEDDLRGDNELFTRLAGTRVTEEAEALYFELSGNEAAGTFELGLPEDLTEIVPPGA